jgi:hypothetical protein
MGRMMRVAFVALVVASGCTAGDVPPGGPQDAATSSGDGRVDARGSIQWVDAAPGTPSNLPCENAATPPSDGHHEPGKSCFQSCHNHGFTLAGTLYTNATGNTGFSGATITVIDANNVTHKIVTSLNGNFYTRDSIAFPLLTIASRCPSAVRMEGSSPNGNCNAGGCHPGGTNQQIHLP